MSGDDVNELHRSLGRVEGKLDSLIESFGGQDKRHEELDRRVGRVEQRQHWYSGAATIIGAIIGIKIGGH